MFPVEVVIDLYLLHYRLGPACWFRIARLTHTDVDCGLDLVIVFKRNASYDCKPLTGLYVPALLLFQSRRGRADCACEVSILNSALLRRNLQFRSTVKPIIKLPYHPRPDRSGPQHHPPPQRGSIPANHRFVAERDLQRPAHPGMYLAK